MPTFIDDQELDRQLREAAPYIDDDGFTVRLLQQLPARRAPTQLRGAILIATTVLASVLCYVLSGGGRFVTDSVDQLFHLPLQWLLGLTFAVGLIIGAIGLAAALFKAREPALIIR